MTLVELAKKLGTDVDVNTVENYFKEKGQYVRFSGGGVTLDDSFDIDDLELVLEELRTNKEYADMDLTEGASDFFGER